MFIFGIGEKNVPFKCTWDILSCNRLSIPGSCWCHTKRPGEAELIHQITPVMYIIARASTVNMSV